MDSPNQASRSAGTSSAECLGRRQLRQTNMNHKEDFSSEHKRALCLTPYTGMTLKHWQKRSDSKRKTNP